jgi:predicted DNA-binding transcriptional regulator AlpA
MNIMILAALLERIMSIQNTQGLETGASLHGPQRSLIAQLDLDDYLRRDELATHLGGCVRTIDRWDVEGKGPPRISIGRTILYSVSSVRAWLLSKEQATLATRICTLFEVKP